MLSQYEPNVKATIAYLRLIKVKVNNKTVSETLQNHPDWPSLLCISDSLNKWDIPNGAGKIAPHDIDQLPTPFIAYTYDRETPLVVVTNITDTAIQGYKKNYTQPIAETKEDFLKKWNGVYLVAEPNQHSGEPNYEANKRKAFFTSLIPAAAFAAWLIISLLLLHKMVGTISPSASLSATGIYLQYLVLLSGVIVTALLLWYEIDKNNPLLQKVCTGIVKGNCNAILTGKQSKLFGWLSWSEVGFFYFTGGLVVLLFAGNAVANSIALIAWLNMLALPYLFFSVFYQWRVAKQWCVLCLAVQGLLVLGAINVLTNDFLFPHSTSTSISISSLTSTSSSSSSLTSTSTSTSTSSFSFIVLLYLLPVLLWYAVKPYMLRMQEAKNTKRQYLRIKFNTEIFDTLLKKQKAITAPADGLGINLGNPAAVNTLIKVCNPYCGPCAKAHPKIESLLEQHDNLQVKIIFNAPNEEDSFITKPIRHLLAIAEKKDKALTKKALDDWYLAEKKEYDLFALKYPMNGELLTQGHKMEAMSKWCKAMEISVTPIIFINGYQLPDAYSIEDINYFLLE